ncbi:hypothetical protein NDU88_009687 [Pleurodeles waltl]|uniref:Uncharacterized protein n=1 Tax=Pleurodeles waltl TaxID=8319 RepID=A0AAV7RZ49_PLEWA|nr:hypothetical protein NDU88_009687 [Pleurodeles waltl]
MELQTDVDTLHKQLAQVTSKFCALVARLEDVESKLRRNYVCLLGFPEHVEGASTEAFVEQWIRDVLNPVGLSTMFTLECAHRALVAPPRPGAHPPAIIVRILHYRDRDCVLRVAR